MMARHTHIVSLGLFHKTFHSSLLQETFCFLMYDVLLSIYKINLIKKYTMRYKSTLHSIHRPLMPYYWKKYWIIEHQIFFLLIIHFFLSNLKLSKKTERIIIDLLFNLFDIKDMHEYFPIIKKIFWMELHSILIRIERINRWKYTS